jgi:hypothetical protein
MERNYMMETQRGFGLVVRAIWTLAGLLVTAAVLWHLVEHAHESKLAFTTPYQAVLLANGSVYFGQLQGYGGKNPVLTNVFYVVSQTNPDTKQVPELRLDHVVVVVMREARVQAVAGLGRLSVPNAVGQDHIPSAYVQGLTGAVECHECRVEEGLS